MTARELRIGNYINPKFPMQVVNIFPDEVNADFEGNEGDVFEFKNEDIEVIPLDEEWLLKLGFEKKSWKSKGIVIECFYYEKNGIIIYLIAKGFEIEVKHNDEQFNLFKVWNNVHQLQNIYFSLTGEELE